MFTIAYNPLAVLGRGRGLAVGVVVIAALGVVAALTQQHLDGALDLHFTGKPVAGATVAIESLVAWLSLWLLFVAASAVFGGERDAVAHLASTALARFPMILAALVSHALLAGPMSAAMSAAGSRITMDIQKLATPGFVVGSLLVLLLVIWYITMLYFGFKEASKLRGGRCAGGFVVGIILAEVVSKLALWPALRSS